MPKFSFKQRVEIIGGFYKGHYGTINEFKRFWPFEYRYKVVSEKTHPVQALPFMNFVQSLFVEWVEESHLRAVEVTITVDAAGAIKEGRN